ncbi:MAG TPA: glutathione peroxidase [Chitinophagales bacterium]|nr:glutathione peroxidase [Chitinophagales bacterium]HNM66970.1 glutathione peroxidase [Chitinophagales bacterium]
MKNSISTFKVKKANQKEINLSDYQGKVLMIVNTASKCGLTPQFEQLEQLYQEFKDQGFEILGFPSNDFAGQEPNSAEDAEQFCQLNYGVSFPIMEKIHVKKGANQHELFKFLGNNTPGPNLLTHPKWNFQKYLINKNGEVIDYYIPTTEPTSEKVKDKIRALLKS